MSIKILSWNINGLRSLVRKNMIEWDRCRLPGLPAKSWDIIAFQESKCSMAQVPTEVLNSKNYSFHMAESLTPGQSGVALLLNKKTFPSSSYSILPLGIKKFDQEGRFQALKTDKFILINAYYPNGRRDHSRVDFKLEFTKEVLHYALSAHKKTKLPLILTGDFNTAHQDIDLKNPKSNQQTSGFLPIEREAISKLIKAGFIDIFRHLHPEEEDAYTWWTYRNKCRERNIGWRIDYFFVQENLIHRVQDCEILAHIPGSDHCPISLILKKGK